MGLVLIVDDDALLLSVMKSFLRVEGHEVISAPDGNKALGIVKSVDLDLVVSDIRMRPMDGMELLKLIKDEKPALPVVMLTAYGSAKTQKEAADLGAFAYLSKPFTNDEVITTVRAAIASGKKQA